ncbi:MAG TPA: OmpA family protein [Croceibacterium sp.]|nr:OmpA family protein [Croceibacterium sp.]
MVTSRTPFAPLALGALAVALMAAAGAQLTGPPLAARLAARAEQAIAAVGGAPVEARFTSANGWPSRHPTLAGGDTLGEGTRDRVAKAVAALPGVGGIRWADGRAFSQSAEAAVQPLHCQEDVEALLRARTLRFEEGSARIDAASGELVDEVARALRPCLGSIIAITGHTDASGPEVGNLELSRARADAVLQALVRRGIPADGLRARGVGSREPVDGLEATDPANRRIEFSVVATQPIRPTPVDLPGPR